MAVSRLVLGRKSKRQGNPGRGDSDSEGTAEVSTGILRGRIGMERGFQ